MDILKWQPIKDAPLGEAGDSSSYFIGGRKDINGRINVATCYRNKYGAYEWWGGGTSPTHFMPMPEIKDKPNDKDI